MKKLAFAVVMSVVAGSASADWWSNGNVVTHVNGGNGGANDISAFNVDPLTTTFGLQACINASGIGPASVADNYTPDTDVAVTKLRVAYYVQSPNEPTLDGGYVRVYAGDPMAGGTLVYGDMVTSRLLSHGYMDNNGHSVYRTAGSTGVNANSTLRRLALATIGTGDLQLTAGQSYYFAWSLSSTVVTSVFCPTLGRRGDGRQELTSNGVPTWFEALGTATNANSDVDLAFELETTAVPEPGTMIAVGAGLVALIARRRKA